MPNKLCNELVLIIQGVRRCEKSTLLTQIPGHYDLPMQNCFFCNFEYPRLPNESDNNLLDNIVMIARKKLVKIKTVTSFLKHIT